MKTPTLIITATALSICILSINALLPVQTRTQEARAASESNTSTHCPAPTHEGSYFERGVDKSGNIVCGFAWFNPCPYSEAIPAPDPMCEKAKPTQEQLAPWQPETQPVSTPAPTVSQCGTK